MRRMLRNRAKKKALYRLTWKHSSRKPGKPPQCPYCEKNCMEINHRKHHVYNNAQKAPQKHRAATAERHRRENLPIHYTPNLPRAKESIIEPQLTHQSTHRLWWKQKTPQNHLKSKEMRRKPPPGNYPRKRNHAENSTRSTKIQTVQKESPCDRRNPENDAAPSAPDKHPRTEGDGTTTMDTSKDKSTESGNANQSHRRNKNSKPSNDTQRKYHGGDRASKTEVGRISRTTYKTKTTYRGIAE